jgi:uncharacterized protein (TIGR03435 family)
MLKSYIIRVAGGLAVLAGAALGQVTTPSKPPLSFEVASIKPVGPLDRDGLSSGMKPGISIDNDRVYIGSLSLMELICQAYEVSRNRVVGGPAWLSRQDAERFGIVAKMADGATRAQAPEMLQALLAARFQVVAHREKRDISVYALVVAKGGPKLEEAVPDPPAPASVSGASETPQANQSATGDAASSKPGSAKGGERYSGYRWKASDNGQERFEYDSLTMERFAGLLSQYLDRPVVDQTGLKGNYQVSYEIDFKAYAMAMMNKQLMTIGKPAVNPAEMEDPIPDPGDAISSSVKKLGLKLESRVLPCDVLVIDRLEKTPTEN